MFLIFSGLFYYNNNTSENQTETLDTSWSSSSYSLVTPNNSNYLITVFHKEERKLLLLTQSNQFCMKIFLSPLYKDDVKRGEIT